MSDTALTFKLEPSDFTRLQRAVGARFRRKHGLLNAAFATQVIAWMFMSLAVFSFFKLQEQDSVAAQPFPGSS